MIIFIIIFFESKINKKPLKFFLLTIPHQLFSNQVIQMQISLKKHKCKKKKLTSPFRLSNHTPISFEKKKIFFYKLNWCPYEYEYEYEYE